MPEETTLQDRIDEVINTITLKYGTENLPAGFLDLFKNFRTNNITIEDWNNLVSQVRDVFSTSNTSKEAIEDIFEILEDVTTAINDCYTKEESDNRYYTKTESDEKYDTKLDKNAVANTVYGHDNQGNQANLYYSSDYNDKSWQLVIRNADSDILVPDTPSSDNAATSKKWVTGVISDIKKNAFIEVDTTTYPNLNSFLVSTGEEGYIYLYPINTSDLSKGYYQYIWENNAWLNIGTTIIDLSTYVTLDSNQTISGIKTFTSSLAIKFGSTSNSRINFYTTRYGSNALYLSFEAPLSGNSSTLQTLYTYALAYGTFYYDGNGASDLGKSDKKWKDLYLGGELKDGTNSITVADIVNGKQATLVNGTNIKSINNTSLLGSGNYTFDATLNESSTNAVQNKVLKGYLDDIGNRLAVLEESIIADDSLNYTYLSDSAIPTNVNTYPIIESAGMDNTNIKGNSFVYNQLCRYATSPSDKGITMSASPNGVVTASGTRSVDGWWYASSNVFTLHYTANHKVLCIGNVTLGSNHTSSRSLSLLQDWGLLSSFETTKQTIYSNASDQILRYSIGGNVGDVYDFTCIPLFFDLTQMGLDSVTTVNEAIAELAKRGINVYEYNPYNVGVIRNSKPTALISKSFNIWDEEWERGQIDWSTGENNASGNQIRSKNYIKVIPNTTYYCYFGSYTTNQYGIYAWCYDKDKNFIGTRIAIANVIFTIPNDCEYIRFCNNADAIRINTYNHDICINISNATLNGQYRPYKAPITYPLSLPVLRSAGNVKDDTKKVNVGYCGPVQSFTTFYGYAQDQNIHAWLCSLIANNNLLSKTNGQIISTEYKMVNSYADMVSTDKSIWIQNPSNIVVHDETLTSYLQAETKLKSLEINVELATPTDQPAITLPENIEFEKGGSLEVTYDVTAPTPSDFDFEVAVYKPIQQGE